MHFGPQALAGAAALATGADYALRFSPCYDLLGAPMRAEEIDHFYREESGRILASLIKLLGDFDLAEEAMQDAFAVAIAQWPSQGLPSNPRAWIVGTARHKALDRIRRRANFESKRSELLNDEGLSGRFQSHDDIEAEASDTKVNDERLRLIFTCCHPALALDLQIALTLRTLCGLSTEEIARAFLVPSPTMAQRLVRAKHKIRRAGIPYRVPPAEMLSERLAGVMATVYLVFNEGYTASSGESLMRGDLCSEAIRLGRLLCELISDRGEPKGLLALMLLQDARRTARVDPEGDLVLLEEQDRSRWNREQIQEGLGLVDAALGAQPIGAYSVQAAIAAVHSRADRPEATNWREIVGLYDLLMRVAPSPIVELNRAVAIAMAYTLEQGLLLIEEIESRGELRGYHLVSAARAGLLGRLGRWNEAALAYRQALSLVSNDAERRFLHRRLAQVEASARQGS
jgi:RNA polymerase sigma-70 factor (ECF subfamily)